MNYLDSTRERSAALQRSQSILTPREFFHDLVGMGWFEPVCHSTEPDVYRITDIGLEELYHLDYSGADGCDR